MRCVIACVNHAQAIITIDSTTAHADEEASVDADAAGAADSATGVFATSHLALS